MAVSPVLSLQKLTCAGLSAASTAARYGLHGLDSEAGTRQFDTRVFQRFYDPLTRLGAWIGFDAPQGYVQLCGAGDAPLE